MGTLYQCSPEPSRPLRLFSPTSRRFLKHGCITVNDDETVTVSDGFSRKIIPISHIRSVTHQYRHVPYYGYPTRSGRYVIAGELVFEGEGNTRLAHIPGGWVGNPTILDDGRSICHPGWWCYDHVKEMFDYAGIRLVEAGIVDPLKHCDTAFSVTNTFHMNRPLPPLSFHPLIASGVFAAPILVGIATISFLS